MNKSILIIVLILFMSISSACGNTGMLQEFISEDSGKVREVKAGDTFLIKLNSNPTTGYRWDVDLIDPAVLQQVGESTYESDSKLISVGGKETFTFKALLTGLTDLRLIYHRQWEKDVPPVETFMMTVVVK